MAENLLGKFYQIQRVGCSQTKGEGRLSSRFDGCKNFQELLGRPAQRRALFADGGKPCAQRRLAQLGKDNFVVRHDAVGRLRHDSHPQLRFCPHQRGAGVVGKAEDLRRDAFFGKGLKQQLFKPAIRSSTSL